MTRNRKAKQAARERSQEAGTSYTAARAELRNPWSAGTEAWARIHARAGFSTGKDGRWLRCAFCGAEKAKLSAGDESQDPGRLELYCDNLRCAAREVAVIVLDNGAEASSRTDVRALAAINQPWVGQRFEPDINWSTTSWRPGEQPWIRTDGKTRLHCLFCGDQGLKLAQRDDKQDCGRLEFDCSNPNCSVQAATYIVVRDGDDARARPDVEALEHIDTPPSMRDTLRPVTISELLRDDPTSAELLARRIG